MIIYARLRKTFDIFDIISTSEIRMDKSIQVTILQLETETKVKALRYPMKFSDDSQPMLNASHMIICHLEDK
jgi:hypothetical protein